MSHTAVSLTAVVMSISICVVLCLASSPAIPTCTVTVFGFPPGQVERILSRFHNYGEIIDRHEGYNWINITYKTPAMAERALTCNGTIINNVMIGVKRAQVR